MLPPLPLLPLPPIHTQHLLLRPPPHDLLIDLPVRERAERGRVREGRGEDGADEVARVRGGGVEAEGRGDEEGGGWAHFCCCEGRGGEGGEVMRLGTLGWWWLKLRMRNLRTREVAMFPVRFSTYIPSCEIFCTSSLAQR